MIEMERIQNLNLELGQEADGKVEDDQTDGRTDGRTRFHIEHQSKLRRSLASSACTSRALAQLLAENARRPRHLSAFRVIMSGSRLKSKGGDGHFIRLLRQDKTELH